MNSLSAEGERSVCTARSDKNQQAVSFLPFDFVTGFVTSNVYSQQTCENFL